MNNRAVFISGIIGLMAAFLVSSYVTSVEDEVRKKFDVEVFVVKARKDIREQETILQDAIDLDKVPKTFAEPGAVIFTTEERDSEVAKKEIASLSGMIALVSIRKGEQITRNKVTQPGIRTGLAPQVAPGRRAISIPVGEFSGVAKLVKPGDRVDVISVVDVGGGKENKLVKTLFQDVVVLATGRHVTNNIARIVEGDPGSSKERVKSLSEDYSFISVTLELEPAQAQTVVLMLATGENSLSLSLRNNDDSERTQLGAITLSDVLGADAARIQRAPGAAQPQGVRLPGGGGGR